MPFECSFEVITCVPLIFWFLFGIDELYIQDCEMLSVVVTINLVQTLLSIPYSSNTFYFLTYIIWYYRYECEVRL